MKPVKRANENAPDDRSFSDAQQFLLLAKRYWSTRLTNDLRASFYDGQTDADASQPQDRTLDATFSWLERHLQRAKYSGRYGLQNWLSRDRTDHEANLINSAQQAHREGVLHLNPELALPDAFTQVDIHQHPGGVWSDPLAGMVYERGARTTTPMAGAKHRDLHDRLAHQLAAMADHPKRILDLGCGFGKSTGPLCEVFPNTQIVAVDIAAPCLVVAAQGALDRGTANVHYRQADARDCGEADNTIDAVTSTMLLHEMPTGHHSKLFAEAYRTLRPGGVMMHLDFLPDVQPAAGPVVRYLHEGHLVRNNEPFMRDLINTNLTELLKQCGFIDISIQAFEEADGTLNPTYSDWRFPWALVSARKPA